MEEEKEFLYKELTYKIIGALYEVHRELGAVHKEVLYHKAVAIELAGSGIDFKEEKSVDVKYKGTKIGSYRPDFIIENKVILELKAVPAITKGMRDQVYFYVKGTGYRLVLLVNFGTPKLGVKRLIYGY